ncbi:unnamed protein product [Trichobilharzia szidati]|nr:unnamed protein product [Trichobilharzia szidati]
MHASSVIVENMPMMPMTPQIVIEIPANTPPESNYNSNVNLNTNLINSLFIQSHNNNNHNNGWSSGASSPGSCYQNLLSPTNYWSKNHYLTSTSDSLFSRGNLKDDDCRLERQTPLDSQSIYSQMSRTPPPMVLLSPTSSVSSQCLNQNRNPHCCMMNGQMKNSCLPESTSGGFQRSNSISLATAHVNGNKIHYPDSNTEMYAGQPSDNHISHPFRSCTPSSMVMNMKHQSNRSLSPYSCSNYPQNANLSRQCIPCLSADSHCSGLEQTVSFHPTIPTKTKQYTTRRASSPLSYKSSNASSQLLCSNNNSSTMRISPCLTKSGCMHNFQRSAVTNKQPSSIQRSNSLPELLITKTRTIDAVKRRKTDRYKDIWYKCIPEMKSCNFYPTPLASSRNSFYPLELPCQQQQQQQQQSYCLSSAMNHRRHTEACSLRPNRSLLLLHQSSRRSNSVCSQNHCPVNMNNTIAGNIANRNIISSMRNMNCNNVNNNNNSNMNNGLCVSQHSFLRLSNQKINDCNLHARSAVSVMLNSKLDDNSSNGNNNTKTLTYINHTSLNKTCSEVCNIPTVNPVDLESTKLDDYQGIIELPVKTGDSFTRCLCSLIVLLVSMQLVVGIASTCLGLFLTWKVPELEFMECAYMSGIPLIISGLIGTCICFRHRIPAISPKFMNIIQVVSGVLSFVCFIICLVTSIYAGQKGSLIASYDNTCRAISIQQQRQHEAHFSQQTTVHSTHSTSPPQPTTTKPNNSSNVLNFIEPCCYEIVKNTCQCFTIHGKCTATYNNLPCRLLFSSIKDYIILQSALMAVGSGVSLWATLLLMENKFKSLIKSKYARLSISSTRSSVPETYIAPLEERTNSIDFIETNGGTIS